jgi:hypothetical protein
VRRHIRTAAVEYKPKRTLPKIVAIISNTPTTVSGGSMKANLVCSGLRLGGRIAQASPNKRPRLTAARTIIGMRTRCTRRIGSDTHVIMRKGSRSPLIVARAVVHVTPRSAAGAG